MSQNMVERESCPRAADRVKRNGTAAPMYTEMCIISTIPTTSHHTTRLGSSGVYINLCNFCTNSLALMPYLHPHWEVV